MTVAKLGGFPLDIATRTIVGYSPLDIATNAGRYLLLKSQDVRTLNMYNTLSLHYNVHRKSTRLVLNAISLKISTSFEC